MNFLANPIHKHLYTHDTCMFIHTLCIMDTITHNILTLTHLPYITHTLSQTQTCNQPLTVALSVAQAERHQV